MVVDRTDWAVTSDYSDRDVATTLLPALTPDWTGSGLLIVPSMAAAGIRGSFVLEVHSDQPVSVTELPESRSKTLAGEWTEGSATGCHLNAEWKKNPRYHLRLNCTQAAKVRITLTRPEAAWRSKCQKDAVGCMMGFYLMQGSRPSRDMGDIFHEGKPWNESPFVPMHSVATPEDFYLDPLPDDEVYTIVPATFEPKKKGPFFLSVVTDADFQLTKELAKGR